jgi:hypothetical protein
VTRRAAGWIITVYVVALGGALFWNDAAARNDIDEWWDLGRAPIALALVLVTLVTFFSFLETSPERQLSLARLRVAIAGTFVLVYLTMLGLFIVSGITPPPGSIASQLLPSFTAATSVVLAFFFGATAAETIWGKRSAEAVRTTNLGGPPEPTSAEQQTSGPGEQRGSDS